MKDKDEVAAERRRFEEVLRLTLKNLVGRGMEEEALEVIQALQEFLIGELQDIGDPE